MLTGGSLRTAAGMHLRGWPSAAAGSTPASQCAASGAASSWVEAAAAAQASHLDVNNDLAVCLLRPWLVP